MLTILLDLQERSRQFDGGSLVTLFSHSITDQVLEEGEAVDHCWCTAKALYGYPCQHTF